MEFKRISLIGIVFTFAISLAFPCETFACWDTGDYKVDCCFVTSSGKADQCCATVEDCCDPDSPNCEYNTWRDQCVCRAPCDDYDDIPITSCPSTSSSSSTIPTTSTTSTTSITTTTCPPDRPQECGNGICCDALQTCCGNECCDTSCCAGSCCGWGSPYCCSGFCLKEDCSGSCCGSKSIYGEDSEEVELLRKYRDEVLSKTPEGRKIIRLYYEWSPVIVELLEEDTLLREYLTRMSYAWGLPMIKAMEEDEEFREKIMEMILVILPLLDNQVE